MESVQSHHHVSGICVGTEIWVHTSQVISLCIKPVYPIPGVPHVRSSGIHIHVPK